MKNLRELILGLLIGVGIVTILMGLGDMMREGKWFIAYFISGAALSLVAAKLAINDYSQGK